MHDAELNVAIAACRANVDPSATEDVEAAAIGANWDRFLAVTERHRVQALCWQLFLLPGWQFKLSEGAGQLGGRLGRRAG